MPSESDLRDLLQDADPEGRAAIDLDAVLSRARRRRRPRLIAAQALSSVALVGVLVTAVGVSLPRGGESAASTAADTAGGTEAQSAPFVDQDSEIADGMLKARECGEPPVTPPLLGWNVAIAPSALAGPGQLGVRVTLANDGPVPESGVATITALTVVRDGVVVGHAFPVDASAPVGPGPGEPTPWDPVALEAVADVESCASAGGPLPPGDYQVLVRIQYLVDGATDGGEPITPPPTTIEIR